MFFDNWQGLGRVALVGVCAYVARLDSVEAVVLETDGSLSILRRPDRLPETLSNVRVPGPEERPHPEGPLGAAPAG